MTDHVLADRLRSAMTQSLVDGRVESLSPWTTTMVATKAAVVGFASKGGQVSMVHDHFLKLGTGTGCLQPFLTQRIDNTGHTRMPRRPKWTK